MLANERNRARLTQEQLAAELGVDQIAISNVENGQPALSDAKIDQLFKRLNLAKASGHAAFLKWWRANSKALTVS
jgi:transcriptional regulator with XRE-family HTH domain